MLKHLEHYRFWQPLTADQLLLRLKTDSRDDLSYWVCYEDNGLKRSVMNLAARTPHYRYFQTVIRLNRPWHCQYYFMVTSDGEPTSYLYKKEPDIPFTHTWSAKDLPSTPYWAIDAIFYQIFPDRFFNGNPSNDPVQTCAWDELPTITNFFGGDLEGIRMKIPYLQEIGVNALWLNPIFAAPSNHRYDTSDYLTVDPALGDQNDLIKLVNELHQNRFHLILDGVFNHTGTEFFAFKDVMLHGDSSPYRDWYYFTEYPVCFEPRPNYACWWDIFSLPKLKVTHTEVRNYLLRVGTYWIEEANIDGWRLDVPNEIEPTFWEEFRDEVKQVNPEAYIVGEIWKDARYWLQRKLFDGVMNYLFRDLILDFFASRKLRLSTFDFLLGKIRLQYPETANFLLLNLLGSHDTPRIINAFQTRLARLPGHTGSYDEAIEHLRPALILQFTYIGIPMIYYGDEIGMIGEADPDCRHTMLWETDKWNGPLRELYKKLAGLRHKWEPLRRGTFQPLLADDADEILAFIRQDPMKSILIVINCSDDSKRINLPLKLLNLPEGRELSDGLSGRKFSVKNQCLVGEIGPNDGAVLCL